MTQTQTPAQVRPHLRAVEEPVQPTLTTLPPEIVAALHRVRRWCASASPRRSARSTPPTRPTSTGT